MKKFLLSGCVCTPSVKGIYTVLFVLILTIPAFAQIEMKDNASVAPFHKWEVNVDLKPLFRQDESYNVGFKWHFTEKKALRLNLGTANYSKAKDSFRIIEEKGSNGQMSTQYFQLAFNNEKKVNWNVRIGYQYEFKQGKISVYTATDADWIKESLFFHTPVQAVIAIDKGLVQPFQGYQSVFVIEQSKNTLGLVQSLGFKYNVNGHLSCSFETSLIGQYIYFHDYVFENPYITNESFTKVTVNGGHKTMFSFKPLMGLFLNYHF